jgi:uncharacterized protein DUF6286
MRIVNRVLAAVLALALLVGGLLVAVEIVVAGFDRSPWVLPHDEWYRSARTRSWDAAPPRWIFIGLVVAGLALLLLELARRRPAALPLTPAAVPADVNRRSLEKALVREANRVDGVAGARARVGAEKADVVAITNRRQEGDLPARVQAALDRRLSALGLARPPAARVKVNARGDR